jgi:Rrf2 family protein
MMVSTKGRYALRVVLDLATHEQEGYVSLTDISARQEVSLKYLESIVASLSKAGYLESHRGKAGGYRLAKSPEECTVGGILKAAEGTISPVSCVGESASECGRADKCLTFPVWRELDKRIDGYLESVTLADVLSGNVEKS